jgi:hypothetical protein
MSAPSARGLFRATGKTATHIEEDDTETIRIFRLTGMVTG